MDGFSEKSVLDPLLDRGNAACPGRGRFSGFRRLLWHFPFTLRAFSFPNRSFPLAASLAAHAYLLALVPEEVLAGLANGFSAFDFVVWFVPIGFGGTFVISRIST